MLPTEFKRFILVGILNTIFSYSLFAMFIYAGIHYTLAVLFATVLGVLFNFRTIGKLVFNHHDSSRFWHFILVYSVIYGLNILGLWMLGEVGVVNKYFSGALLLVPLAVISFILNRRFVFNKQVDL